MKNIVFMQYTVNTRVDQNVKKNKYRVYFVLDMLQSLTPCLVRPVRLTLNIDAEIKPRINLLYKVELETFLRRMYIVCVLHVLIIV